MGLCCGIHVHVSDNTVYTHLDGRESCPAYCDGVRVDHLAGTVSGR